MKKIVIIGLCLVFCASLGADFKSISHTTSGVPKGNISFSLLWNGTPDFQTVDEYERQLDGFQLYIFPTNSIPPLGLTNWYEIAWSAIVRGGEIYKSNNIVIRTNLLPFYYRNEITNIDPSGWGTLVKSIEFTNTVSNVTNTITSFVVNYASLGVTNRFYYSVMVCRKGASYYWNSVSANVINF